MKKAWVLVAESSRAKVFEQDHARSPLTEINDFDHSASRMNDIDLVSSAPGRTFDSHGMGRHSIEPDTDPKVNEANIFAHILADHLAQHCGKDFDKLIVIAPPEFLGTLRGIFSDSVSKSIVASINKNLIHETSQTIAEHLPFTY